MKFSRELKAGVVTIITLVTFAFLVSFLKGESFFSGGKSIYVVYDNISDLETSRSVTVNGIKVGTVKNIDFYKEDITKNIVELSIDTDYPLTDSTVAVIIPASVLGTTTMKLLPTTKGSPLKDETFLKGIIEVSAMNSAIDQIEPLKGKLESMMLNLDKNLVALQGVLSDENTAQITSLLGNLNQTVVGFKQASTKLDQTISSANGLIGSTNGLVKNADGMIKDMKGDISSTLQNFNQTSKNINDLSGDLKQADLGKSIAKLDQTLTNINKMMAGVENGKGSLGKLMKDEKLYDNLEGATAELELLMKDFKENPKRYVHFSVFGRKDKKNKNKDLDVKEIENEN